MRNVRAATTLGPFLAFLLAAIPLRAQLPDGFEPYLGMKDQFELALPNGWSVFDQVVVTGGKPGKAGPPVIFSSELIDARAMLSGDKDALQKVIAQLSGVEVGSISGFILDRLPTRKGMSCKGFDRNAEKQLLSLLGTDPMFGKGRVIREHPRAEAVTIGGCQGLRVKGKGTASTGAGKNLDIYAVSDGNVLFLFKLLNLDEYYQKNIGAFEQIMSTLTLAAASGAGR